MAITRQPISYMSFYTFELAKHLHAEKRQNIFGCVQDIIAFKGIIQGVHKVLHTFQNVTAK